MAGEANASFLPLEGLATQNGKALTYGMSGSTAVLPAMQSTGGVENHATAALTVPMQKIALQVMQPVSGSGELVVPLQEAAGVGGAQAAVVVPKQVLAGAGTVLLTGRANLTVPLQVVAGSGLTGAAASAALTVPMQVLSTSVGSSVALAVPMQVLAAQASWAITGTAELTVPLQTGTGTIVTDSYASFAAVVVPIIVPAPMATAALVVPSQYVATAVQLPGDAGDFTAWAMNVRNGGVTRFTNFPFIQFARTADSTYAVGNDGNLYLLGGDLDVAAPISWQVETGLDDLGSPGIKHIPYLYLDGIIDGEVEITLIDDKNREFVYYYDTKTRGAVHQPHKRKLGNGVRTRNVAFRIASTTGAYIELDSLEPEGTVTQRSV